MAILDLYTSESLQKTSTLIEENKNGNNTFCLVDDSIEFALYLESCLRIGLVFLLDHRHMGESQIENIKRVTLFGIGRESEIRRSCIVDQLWKKKCK